MWEGLLLIQAYASTICKECLCAYGLIFVAYTKYLECMGFFSRVFCQVLERGWIHDMLWSQRQSTRVREYRGRRGVVLYQLASWIMTMVRCLGFVLVRLNVPNVLL